MGWGVGAVSLRGLGYWNDFWGVTTLLYIKPHCTSPNTDSLKSLIALSYTTARIYGPFV